MCNTVRRDLYRWATHFCNACRFILVLISTVTVHRKKRFLLFSVLVFYPLSYFIRSRLHRAISMPKIQMLKDPQKSCLFLHCSLYASWIIICTQISICFINSLNKLRDIYKKKSNHKMLYSSVFQVHYFQVYFFIYIFSISAFYNVSTVQTKRSNIL